ncbi:MAG: hypothetical protein LBC73_09660 [Oscillospiraceae bacterium]|jgi:hypothetical protein|nr:hypothetical protein [Oscillospiraceae bacterium]
MKKIKNFKLTRQHWEGAVAMLLICTIIISAVSFAMFGPQFGTIFDDYEEAEEQFIAISPASIDATSDYAGQAFTLSGLPENELRSIKPEHIFLGGFFEALEATSLQINGKDLIVNVAPAPPRDPSDLLEQPVSADGVDRLPVIGDPAPEILGRRAIDGFIAVSPEPFRDRSYFYMGVVDVIFPTLVSQTESIGFDFDFNVSQNVVLDLENDTFVRTITAEDIFVGGFKSYNLTNFENDGNRITFTLDAVTTADNAYAFFSIIGDLLTKEYGVSCSISLGRVPMPHQVSRLSVMNRDTQTLDIFIEYDTFTQNISADMLTLTGVMEAFQISELIRVDDNNISLVLSGRAAAGIGTVRFGSAAVESGRLGRVAEITVTPPIIDVNHYPTSENPSFNIIFDGIGYLEEGDVYIEFGGVLSGLSINEMIWGSVSLIFSTTGTVEQGEAVIHVRGLYDASSSFTFIPIEIEDEDMDEEEDAGEDDPDADSETDPDPDADTDTDPDADPDTDNDDDANSLSSTGTSGIAAVSLVSGGLTSGQDSDFEVGHTFGAEDGVQVEQLSAAVVTTATKIAAFAFNAFWTSESGNTTREWINNAYGIGMAPTVEQMLRDLAIRLNELENLINENHQAVLARFDKLDYSGKKLESVTEYERMRNYSRQYRNDIAGGGSEEWRKANLLYNPNFASGTSTFLSDIRVVLNALDPKHKSAYDKTPNSLIHSFVQMLTSSGVPFEHNVATALYEYVAQWQMELDEAFAVIMHMSDYTFDNGSEELYKTMYLQTEPLVRRYQEVLENIDEYFGKTTYYRAYKWNTTQYRNISSGRVFNDRTHGKFEMTIASTGQRFYLCDPKNNIDYFADNTTIYDDYGNITYDQYGNWKFKQLDNIKAQDASNRHGKSIIGFERTTKSYWFYPSEPRVAYKDAFSAKVLKYSVGRNDDKNTEFDLTKKFKQNIQKFKNPGESLNDFFTRYLIMQHTENAKSVWEMSELDYLYYGRGSLKSKTFSNNKYYRMFFYDKSLNVTTINSDSVTDMNKNYFASLLIKVDAFNEVDYSDWYYETYGWYYETYG